MAYIDKEYLREDELYAKLAEERALKSEPQVQSQCLPTAEYLQAQVMPHLQPALIALAKERPADPVEFFAYYLLTQRGK